MNVLRVGDVGTESLAELVSRFGMRLVVTSSDEPIPGSFWGDSEAGLIGDGLHVRLDTPVHSVLHESAHFLCMSPARREGLARDAGGDDAEETAVCYLQVLLSDDVPEMGRGRMFADMDAWGYSFRLGSSRDWFENDAEDAVVWLRQHDLLDESGRRL